MNKILIRYSLFAILFIVILLGSIYFFQQIKCPELLVKDTIEKSIGGKLNDLEISEESKNTLYSFFSNIAPSNHIQSSIKLINKTNRVSEFLISIEQINYTDNNDVLNVIHGNIRIEINHSSFFQCHISNIEILKKI